MQSFSWRSLYFVPRTGGNPINEYQSQKDLISFQILKGTSHDFKLNLHIILQSYSL
jgi:hypothetical protein